jgi:hypothetical protein
VRIGFQYLGLDGAQVGLDAILLDGQVTTGFPWMSEDPISGTLPTGQCQIVDVLFDATSLAPGDYHAYLIIDSNDPDTPTTTADVSLAVLAQHG